VDPVVRERIPRDHDPQDPRVLGFDRGAGGEPIDPRKPHVEDSDVRTKLARQAHPSLAVERRDNLVAGRLERT
jgi:hypothetical protein